VPYFKEISKERGRGKTEEVGVFKAVEGTPQRACGTEMGVRGEGRRPETQKQGTRYSLRDKGHESKRADLRCRRSMGKVKRKTANSNCDRQLGEGGADSESWE